MKLVRPMSEPRGLPALEAALEEEFRLLGPPVEPWVPAYSGVMHDVLIVGGGQSGITIAHALRRAGVERVSIVESEPQHRAGSWQSKGRMQNLRTSKFNRGPDLEIPSLTFRAWHEARYGCGAYDRIERASTRDWIDYLEWLRSRTNVSVRYDTKLIAVEPSQGLIRARLQVRSGKSSVETCRKLILATGMAGCGQPNLPDALNKLPSNICFHTDGPIPFNEAKGQTVVVFGAASSAFDAASTALEAGAAEVHLLCRHAKLAPSSNMSALKYPAAQDHFSEMPDPIRWRLAKHFRERSPGPTAEVVRRATRFENFRLHLGAMCPTVTLQNGRVNVLTGTGSNFTADIVIAGTGYRCDLSKRPELAGISPDIALWRDRFDIPHEDRDLPNGAFPYLGAGYEFLEKRPGTAPWLHDIHCFNFAATNSFGRHVGDVGSLRAGVPRLVRRLVRDLFLADLSDHVARLTGPVEDELREEDYAHAVVMPPALVADSIPREIA